MPGLLEPFTREEMAQMRRRARAADPSLAGFWAMMKRVMARLPFAEDVAAAWFAVADRRTPPRVRMILAGAIAYFVLPVDAVPDFIPGLGFTDDAAVLATAFAAVRGAITPEHLAAARRALAALRADVAF